MDPLSARERLLRTLRGEPTDRIPIFPPVAWRPGLDDAADPPEPWMAEPAFQDLIPLVEAHGDPFVPIDAFGTLSDRRFFQIPDRYIEELPSQPHADQWHTRRYVVHTPDGDLRTVGEGQGNGRCNWCVEPLVKSREDVDKLLSVPFECPEPDVAGFTEARERVGEAGLLQIGVSSPVAAVWQLVDFERFTRWCVQDRGLVLELERVAQERTLARLRQLVDAGLAADTVLLVGGSELCTPPLMGVADYDELVAPFEAELCGLWHEAGGWVRVHCHGKVGEVFNRIVGVGADCVDPMEPPPEGDLPLCEARIRSLGRTTLMGNIDYTRLVLGTPDEVEQLVRQAIEQGGPDHFILYPTAQACEGMTQRHSGNCVRYIEAGLRYGTHA